MGVGGRAATSEDAHSPSRERERMKGNLAVVKRATLVVKSWHRTRRQSSNQRRPVGAAFQAEGTSHEQLRARLQAHTPGSELQ